LAAAVPGNARLGGGKDGSLVSGKEAAKMGAPSGPEGSKQFKLRCYPDFLFSNQDARSEIIDFPGGESGTRH
jgi:hypothetical protein